jgi:hypothetical protein
MNKIYSLFLILIVVSSPLFSQQTKHVAFLGNSYTNVNDLPLIVSKLAQSAGDQLVYNSNTPGGYTLQGHSTNSASIALIQQGTWDYVVLQEQSQLPSFPMSQVSTDVFPYATALCNMITQYNSCAKPLFFMTWGRKYGDSQNCSVWPPVCTYEGMDSLLNLRYRMMANSNHAYVSPVGAVWRYIRTQDSTIELYSSDFSHPSLIGSYAAACTFYTLIFEKDPLLISDDYNIDHSIAMQIRDAVKIIAFDSLQKWNVGKFDPRSSFNISQSGNSIQTINNSLYSSNYHWDFGDGDTSNLFEPAHSYASDGTYHITLTSSKCNKSDNYDTNIVVNTQSIYEFNKSNIEVFPNPVSDILNVNLNKAYENTIIKIFSIDSKVIAQYSFLNKSKINLSTRNLKKGLYLISIEADTNIVWEKIIIN